MGTGKLEVDCNTERCLLSKHDLFYANLRWDLGLYFGRRGAFVRSPIKLTVIRWSARVSRDDLPRICQILQIEYGYPILSDSIVSDSISGGALPYKPSEGLVLALRREDSVLVITRFE
jgi:hypothetical protein